MTGRVIPLDGEGHVEIVSLLPWYVAGCLDEHERARVEAHLADCAECQAELKAERRIASLLEDIPAPEGDVEAGWRRMQARLAAPRSPPPQAARAAAGWRRFWRIEPAWASWALAAQACLVVGLAAALLQAPRPEPYRALGAQTEAAAAGGGTIVVVFRPDTTEAQLREIVRGARGRLVGGPTEADAYLIAAPLAERPAALAALRARPQVVLAEPIDGAEGP